MNIEIEKTIAETLYFALVNAREELEAWRGSFPNYGDSEEVACQIDNAIEEYEQVNQKPN